MSRRYHQAITRKDGPVHALEHYSRDKGYADCAACGTGIGLLHQVKARTWKPEPGACKRCIVAVGNS